LPCDGADVNFVPTTGYSDAVTAASLATKLPSGPLYDFRAQIKKIKTAGFAVTYTPSASTTNNSGSVLFGYFPESSINNLWNGQVVAPSQAATNNN